MAETLTIRTSASTDVIKVVERGPQGPTGPQGPAGEGGASTWNDITGKPATFPPSAHDHQPGEVYADAAFVSQTGGSGRGGIYLRNGSDNGKPLYESPATGDYIWWDSNIDTWYLTSRTDVNLFEITNNTDNFPWETDALWQPIAPQTGNVEVDQASLFDVSDYSSTSVVGLKTPKSGNASSDELVLGSDTRLTNSRTPTAHASTHATGGSDALTPANIGAAPAVNVIELTPSPGSNTITTSQLPARGIAYAPTGETTYTVNLPTPDIRQSGLTFSIKTEYEEGSGVVFITVVHNASDLLTSYELDEDESSLDFLWDGYRWTYSSANWLYSYPNRRLVIPPLSGTLGLSEPADNVFRIVGSSDATKKVAFEVDTNVPTTSTVALTVPSASGTIARTEDFAAPPAIGNTTPAAGSFTTLTATPAANTTALTSTGYSLTGSNAQSLVDLAGTWNTTGVPIAFKTNLTVTAAGSNSMYADFQAGGYSQFGVSRISSTSNALWLYNTNSGTNTNGVGANFERGFLRWSSNVLQIGTEKAGTGSARALAFQTDGTTRWTIVTGGDLESTANGVKARSCNLGVFGAGDLAISSNAAGIRLGVVDDTCLFREGSGQLGQRSGTQAQLFRLYNTSTSGNANFERANLRWASNEFIIDAEAGGSGTSLRGIKLGSATSSLLGFYGATPVDRPATVADPAGGGTVDAEARTAINDIIDRLQELGLIA